LEKPAALLYVLMNITVMLSMTEVLQLIELKQNKEKKGYCKNK
jgi:hypothetical protein